MYRYTCISFGRAETEVQDILWWIRPPTQSQQPLDIYHLINTTIRASFQVGHTNIPPPSPKEEISYYNQNYVFVFLCLQSLVGPKSPQLFKMIPLFVTAGYKTPWVTWARGTDQCTPSTAADSLSCPHCRQETGRREGRSHRGQRLPSTVQGTVSEICTCMYLFSGYTCMSRIAPDCPGISYAPYLTTS